MEKFFKILQYSKNLKNIKKLMQLVFTLDSQITSIAPYQRTLNAIRKIIKLSKINFDYVDLGSGFGIQYKNKDKKIDIKKYSNLVQKFQKKLVVKLFFEPGRYIIGNTGSLISKLYL